MLTNVSAMLMLLSLTYSSVFTWYDVPPLRFLLSSLVLVPSEDLFHGSSNLASSKLAFGKLVLKSFLFLSVENEIPLERETHFTTGRVCSPPPPQSADGSKKGKEISPT
jgi:hypothetical protein